VLIDFIIAGSAHIMRPVFNINWFANPIRPTPIRHVHDIIDYKWVNSILKVYFLCDIVAVRANPGKSH
jgi:hypothetical protein